MDLKSSSSKFKECIRSMKNAQKAREQAKKMEQQAFEEIRELREEQIRYLKKEKENLEKKKGEYKKLIKRFLSQNGGLLKSDMLKDKDFLWRDLIRHKEIVEKANQQEDLELQRIAKRILEIEKEEREIQKNLKKKMEENRKFFEENGIELEENNLMQIFDKKFECQYCGRSMSYHEYMTEHFWLIKNCCKIKN